MVMEGDLTWSGAHTVQCMDDVLQNCTPETYIILLTNAIPINSMKKKDNGKQFSEVVKPTQTPPIVGK